MLFERLERIMFTTRPLAILFAAVAFAPRSSAQQTGNSVESRTRQLFAAYDRNDCPGCAVCVLRNGSVVFSAGFGMANLEHDVAITMKTVFDIASTAKQFTAASVALLAERKKLSLDDDVRKFVPELPRYDKPITVRDLVHH